MWTDVQFWKDATWRAFRSFCQCLAALLGGQAVNALTANWLSMLSVSGTAALLSLLMSIDRGRAVVGVGGTDVITPEPVPAPYANTGLVVASPASSGVVPLGGSHEVTVSCGDGLK